jgi:neuronal cell adhesion molecule
VSCLEILKVSTKFTRNIFFSYYIEQTSAAAGSAVPEIPNFAIEKSESENGFGKAKVTWRPNYAGTPGSHFFVQYRKKGEPTFLKTEPQINEDHIIVGSLEPNEEYEFRVVSVDGDFETASAVQQFDASSEGEFWRKK